MGAQRNAAPVVVKRKKVVHAHGHHGGAWKVAYADFVTAMMAFFLLMWLLNATTEKQRKGIADYFSPSVPLARVSGGGDGAFGGENLFSEQKIAQLGTGVSALRPSAGRQTTPQAGVSESRRDPDSARFDSDADRIRTALSGFGGESMAMRKALRHITTRVTDEGLIAEISDLHDSPLFIGATAEPQPVLRDVAAMLARVFALVVNPVAVNGHVRASPQVLRADPGWPLSWDRADRLRLLMESSGFDPRRTERVTGYSDRRPVLRDPAARPNNRIEVILLRSDRRADERGRALGTN